MTAHSQHYRNMIAVLIVICILALMLLLSGCTIYKVHSVPGESAKVSIYSTRSFEAPELSYDRRGNNATFKFGADAATQPGPDDYAKGVIGGIEMYKLSNVCVAKNRIDERIMADNRPDEFTTGYIAGMTTENGRVNINGLRCANGEMPACSCP